MTHSAIAPPVIPNTSISELDTDIKVFVMEAIRRLVDDGLAEWDRTEDGELELRLITGETFVVSDTGITPKERSHDVAPMPPIHHRWWGAG